MVEVYHHSIGLVESSCQYGGGTVVKGVAASQTSVVKETFPRFVPTQREPLGIVLLRFWHLSLIKPTEGETRNRTRPLPSLIYLQNPHKRLGHTPAPHSHSLTPSLSLSEWRGLVLTG